MEVTARKYGAHHYVNVDGSAVAVMRRSPFTGEFIAWVRRHDWIDVGFTNGQSTGRKSAKAAAKVAVERVMEGSQS